MLITDFEEIVEIKRKRQGKSWKDLADVIGKTDTYTRMVVKGVQRGPKADEYRQMIADNLEITLVKDI